MEKIILFTNMSSIQRHWEKALRESYTTTHIDRLSKLIAHLDIYTDSTTILFDEMSTQNIHEALSQLKRYHFAKVLVFNAVPEVHHASTLLNEGIQGYENSFLDKENLLKMLSNVENDSKWLFADLTHYIINKYIKHTYEDKTELMSLLTEKEKDIALMVSDGLSNKEIAQKEKIALSTVKGHIHHIFEKTGVSDRISLALKFK